MRLEKIKIAGFKSFVDPTTVSFPSNLVGVIGPNGCGKSNVIDAVRWVMGESSAKMLRGESMTDVIFSGSTSRKPVGAASVELVFDNSDGTVGGEYSNFNQISIKRKVTRDGQSIYFLNTVRCRRRDITDIFLGTGLGPRSYSIIEQGMISRFVEAKPDEMRVFIEEAAGISKYKERRKETESRISNTRENLERLTDLREEVAKQLQHLERQAATAEKYKILKQEERQSNAELMALRWKDLDQDLAERDRVLNEMETAFQAIITDQRRIESEMEKQRDAQHDSNDSFNQIQGQFYAIGADIARLEEGIQYSKNARAQQKNDLQQVEQAWQESQDHITQDQARQSELEQLLEKELPIFEEYQSKDEALNEELKIADSKMQSWQQEWDAFNLKATEPAQVAQIERTKINHIEEQEQNYQRRLTKNHDEQSRLNVVDFEKEIDEFTQKVDESEIKVKQFNQQLESALTAIKQSRDTTTQKNTSLNTLRTEHQTSQGRLSSLEALQQDAMGKKEDAINEWLDQGGLSQAGRLLENINVDSQWQTAVETVLAFHLQSICVDDFDQSAGRVSSLSKGQLALFDLSSVNSQDISNQDISENSLLNKVKTQFDLSTLLIDIKTVSSLDDALKIRSSLKQHESLITKDGVWLGSNWLRVNRVADQQGGMIAREQEIKSLRLSIVETADNISKLEGEIASQREETVKFEQSREQLQKEINALNRQLGDWRANIASRKTRVETINNRLQVLKTEYSEIEQQIVKGKNFSEESSVRLHAALSEMENHASKRDELIKNRDDLREKLQHIKDQVNQDKHKTHEIALRIESMRSSLESLKQNLSRMLGQIEHLSARKKSLADSLGQSEQPLEEQQKELDTNLEKRLVVETRLLDARKQLETIDNNVRELEQERLKVEAKLQTERERITQSKMQRQEALVHYQSLKTQISEAGHQVEELLEQISDDATASVWKDKVEVLERRISRLGAINLAAIEEFKEKTERMEYLDTQNKDITESLETLENAIRKIDRETRTRFRETFDIVDSGLKELFPKVFGGGHAYLQLTGEDVLDAGVSIMARPPGKRNSSIHLLSGGEKALTAVALVFAIFKINPAPFCMLDEVDAPLDDANVGRFCSLVKEMSETVQFVFITHNKVTMEIANQLSGVTMQEPGVSRLVTVDIDEAAKLAVM